MADRISKRETEEREVRDFVESIRYLRAHTAAVARVAAELGTSAECSGLDAVQLESQARGIVLAMRDGVLA